MAEQRGKGSGGRDRGVGGLVGAGPSLVGVAGSMRARDVSRPTDEDLAAAEERVVIRRRPPDAPLPPLPGTRRTPKSAESPQSSSES